MRELSDRYRRQQYRSRARLLASECSWRGHHYRKTDFQRARKYHRWAARLREVANG